MAFYIIAEESRPYGTYTLEGETGYIGILKYGSNVNQELIFMQDYRFNQKETKEDIFLRFRNSVPEKIK